MAREMITTGRLGPGATGEFTITEEMMLRMTPEKVQEVSLVVLENAYAFGLVVEVQDSPVSGTRTIRWWPRGE